LFIIFPFSCILWPIFMEKCSLSFYFIIFPLSIIIITILMFEFTFPIC
jgi:hypothetical protein